MFRVATRVTIFLAAAASTAFAADLDATIEGCNGCHGDGGVSQWTDVPSIAGLSELYHADQLYIYRDEDRSCENSAYRQGDTSRPETNMCAVSADLSDDDIDAIAVHYAELAFVPAKQAFDAALATAGKSIHEAACSRCHSDGGANPEDDAGILAGQHMGYMKAAFGEYAADEREQPPKMKEKMTALSADDQEALLHYYASQQ